MKIKEGKIETNVQASEEMVQAYMSILGV